VRETLAEAGTTVAELIVREAEATPRGGAEVNLGGIEEVVADKGYHSGPVLQEMQAAGVRTYIPEKKQAGKRHRSEKDRPYRPSSTALVRSRTSRNCAFRIRVVDGHMFANLRLPVEQILQVCNARARRLPLGRKRGKARMEAMTPKQRREVAGNAFNTGSRDEPTTFRKHLPAKETAAGWHRPDLTHLVDQVL